MVRSQVVNLSEYKDKILMSSNSLPGGEVAVDTVGSQVDVISEISYSAGSVWFDITDVSFGAVEYKTWGDYDVTSHGINHNLCGDTEANAPWVPMTSSIQYSLGNASPFVSHVFHFAFKDSNENEITVDVVGEYEKTVLIDVSDFAGTKEQYFTIMLDSDSAVSGFDYKQEMTSFDTFMYMEAVTDKPSARPNVVFGKDILTSKELSAQALIVNDSASSSDMTFFMMPPMDQFTSVKDSASVDVDMLMTDSVKASVDMQFMLEADTEVGVENASSLVNMSLFDAAGPYGVFFYFAVKLKVAIEGDESLEFLHHSSERALSDESSGLLMPAKVALYGIENQVLLERLIQKESPFIKDDALFFFAEDEISEDISSAISLVYPSDWGCEFTNPWVDVDHLMYDSVKSYASLEMSIPVDYFGVSDDVPFVDMSLFDIGFQPGPPEWKFEVNAFESLNGSEALITSLFDLDYSLSAEYGLHNMVLSDVVVVPDPKWLFEVNSFEKLLGQDTSVLSLSARDYLAESDDALVSMSLMERVKEFTKLWANADLLMYDRGNEKESIGFVVPIDQPGISFDQGLPELKTFEWGEEKSIFNEELLFKESGDLVLDAGLSVFSEERFVSWEQTVLDLYGSQMSVSRDLLTGSTKMFYESGSSSQSYFMGVNGADAGVSSGFVVSNLALSQEAFYSDTPWFIDVDLLQKDSGELSFKDVLMVPSMESFIETDATVVTLAEWDYSKAKFIVSISTEEHPTEYIYAFEWAFYKEHPSQIEIRGKDPGVGYDGAIVLLDLYDLLDYSDLLTTFEKQYVDFLYGKDYAGPLQVMSEDAGVMFISPLLGVYFDESLKGSDLLVEFQKSLFDLGSLLSEVPMVHNLSLDFGVSIEDTLLGTLGTDAGWGKDLLSELWRNYFDSSVGVGDVLLQSQGDDVSLGHGSSVLNIPGGDVGVGRDFVIEFYRTYIDGGVLTGKVLIQIPGDQLFSLSDSSIIQLPLDDVAVTKDVLINFKKWLIDAGESVGTASIQLVGAELGSWTDFSVMGVAFTDPIVGDEKQRLLEHVKGYDPIVGVDLNWITAMSQELGQLDEVGLLQPFTFEYAFGGEVSVIDSRILQKDYSASVDDIVITIPVTGKIDYSAESVILPTGADFGFESAVVDIEDISKEYYIYVNEFGFGKDYPVGVALDGRDYSVIIEQGILNVIGSDVFTIYEYHVVDSLLYQKDPGYSCYNTIIYDPTITQRDLLYWWEPGYLPGDHLSVQKMNPLWTKPIKPGDIDYPYYPGDPLYGVIINYINSYEFPGVQQSFSLSVSRSTSITAGTHVYLSASSKSVKIPLTGDALKVEFDAPVQVEVDLGVLPVGADPEFFVDFGLFLNLYVNGLSVVSKQVSLSDYVRVDFIEGEYVGEDPLKTLLSYAITEKGTGNIDVILSPISDMFGEDFDFDTNTYAVEFELKPEIKCVYTASTPISGLFSIKTHCNYWLGIPEYNSDYPVYRSKYVYNADELFTALDPYPGFMSYKLYINLECGVEPEYIWSPKTKMEQFVLDKAMKFTHLDLIMPFAGDLVTVQNSEDAVVMLSPKVEYSGIEHIGVDVLFKVFDAGAGCFNTIIYDPTITQRSIHYWWEPNYAPGGEYYRKAQDPMGEYFRRNPDWGKPIVPMDIDYPFFKGDKRYGQTIPLYVAPKTVYSAWNGFKTWKGWESWWPPINPSVLVPFATDTIHSENDDQLFTSDAPIFSMKMFQANVREYHPDVVQSIPWDTDFAITVECFHADGYGKYKSLGKEQVPVTIAIQSQVWTDDHTRETVYDFTPDGVEINCYDLFPYYDLSKDHFEVSLHCDFHWYGTWHVDVQYRLTAEYTYSGEWSPVDPLYVESRRQVIYEDDQWFVPTDVLYYDPIMYKLYINIDCGLPYQFDRVPENSMDKFVLDKMTKYPKLNIMAPFIGDHGVSRDDAIISLFSTQYYVAGERWEIVYTLLFRDFGYSCEDTVVYSPEIHDRDLMYWWEKDYPVVVDTDKLIPNPLLGKSIKPKDFDYPYDKLDPKYGMIINPGKHKADPYFNPSKHRAFATFDSAYYIVNDLFFPLKPVTDGMEITLTGHVRANVGKVKLTLVVVRYADISDYPTRTPVEISSYYYLDDIVLMPVAEAEAARGDVSAIGEYPFWPVDTRFVNLKYTLRYQDLADKYSLSTDLNFYVGVLAEITTMQKSIVVPDFRDSKVSCGYDYYIDFSADVEEYADEYLSYRVKAMHPTDGGFITRDFYNDLFGFKFYVNLGCGPDLDAFPIDNDNDLERWVFSRARTGNFDMDYWFDGDLGQVIEDPVIELKELWTIHMKFHWYFNNFEFWVFDSGVSNYLTGQVVLGSDGVSFMEGSPIISIPETDVLTASVRNTQFVRTTLHEQGVFEVTPLLDLLGAERGSILDTSVINIAEKDSGLIDYAVKFVCYLTAHEDILGVGQEVVNAPADGMFFVDEDSTISLTSLSEGKSDERNRMVEFLFVYDEGKFIGKPLVNDPVDNLYYLWSEADVGVAVKYVGVAKEHIWHDRNEVLRDIGYVCFWVQIVSYPYVIDWLAGHFVDYVNNAMEAEYFRFTSCFGLPPGGWPKIQNFPDHRIVPGTYGPKWEKRPGHEDEGYRRREPIGNRRERTEGYIRFPHPSGEIIYIPDPVNPPEPYEWVGGTAIFLSKSIFDINMDKPLVVEDMFYFALFDEFGNIVSDVQSMPLTETTLESAGVVPGACFGAMVFFDLDPHTTYYIKETDKDGNILGVDLVSDFSGNKYLTPQDGLKVTTGDEGQCVDGGDFNNLVESFGTGHRPLPISGPGHSYNPRVYPTKPDGTGKGPGRPAPFVPTVPTPSFPPSPIPPYSDGEYFPPVGPYPFPVDDRPEDPIPVPGYEGKVVHNTDITVAKGEARITVPVDMLASIWEYHYIPATFVLELTGVKIEFLDGFEFEIEEPFKFDFDGFKFEFEEPFKFDATLILIDIDPGFSFEEYNLQMQYVQEFHLAEVFFEFEMLFEDFKFDEIEYDGEQIVPAMEVVSEIIVYDGDSHSLCYPKGTHGTVYYQVDGEDDVWSTEIPVRTNAGSYLVKWYSMASLDYTGYGSPTEYHLTNCSIRKASAEFSIEEVVVEYGSDKDFEFIYTGDGEVSCNVDDAEVANTVIVSQERILTGTKTLYKVVMRVHARDCGSTIVHIVSTSGDNYFPGEKSIVCQVIATEMRFVALPVEVRFTGEPVVGNITVFGPDQYTILYSPNSLVADETGAKPVIDFFTEVGDYTVYFVIKSLNYKSAYGKFRLSITLIPQSIVITTYSDVYDSMAHPLITNVDGVFGTMWYSIDGVNWDAEVPYGALPGRYTIYWYCVGDENHYDDGTSTYPNTIVAEIEKMSIDANIDDLVLDMVDPSEVIVDIPTPSHGRFRLTYSDYSVIAAKLGPTSVIISPLKVGDVFVYVKQLEDFFYKEHTFIFHVSVIDTRIIYEALAVVAVFNDSFIDKTGVVITNPDQALCNIRYSKTPIGPTTLLSPTPAFYKDPGEYIIYFMVSAFGYTTVYDSYTLTIEEARVEYTADPIIVRYDGSVVSQSGVEVTYPEAGKYTIKYAKTPIGPGTTLYTLPAFYSDAGDYTIYFVITAHGFETVYGSYGLTINTRDIEFVTSPVVVDYTGSYVSQDGITITNPYVHQCDIRYAKQPVGPSTALYPTPEFYKAPGMYTIYFRITAFGYTSVTGSYQLVINSLEVDITGMVVSATTGLGVSGARVVIRKGGIPVRTVTTGSDGSYSAKLDKNTTYVAEVTCDGYITETFEFNVVGDQSQVIPQFVLMPEIADQIRLVLTWGEKPYDLDSYLMRKAAYGKSYFMLSYYNRKIYDDGELVAELDVDTKSGYGPETVTIYDTQGEFLYSIKDFTESSLSINATVKIYVPGARSPKVITCTQVLGNKQWYVCRVVNGVVTILNDIAD